MSEEVWVPCQVGMGLTRDERYVEIKENARFWIYHKNVRTEHEPPSMGLVPGLVRVYVVDRHDGKVLVGTSGIDIDSPRVWIPESSCQILFDNSGESQQ